MKYKKFITIDAETSCLRLIDNKPWQFGFEVFDHSKTIDNKEYWIWWPDLKMSDGAAKITKFDWDTYERKANPKYGAPTSITPEAFLDILESYILNEDYGVVHQNGLGFDTYIIGYLQKLIRGKANYNFVKRSFDTMLCYRGLKMGLKPDVDNLIAWQYKILHDINSRKIKANLKALSNEYGIEYDESQHHVNALWDVNQTTKIFNKMKYQLQ